MAERSIPSVYRYVIVVLLGGVVLATALIAEGALDRAFGAPPEFWLFVVFLLVGELLPVRVPRRDEDEEITTSVTFAYAMFLIAGIGAAVLAHMATTFLADVIRRKPWWKAGFNASQYALTLGAAGGLTALITRIPHPDAPPAFNAVDLPGIAAGAIVFFLVNHALTRTAIALAQGLPVGRLILTDVGFQATTTAVLLSLSPIVVVAAERSLALVPLLAVPMIGAYRSVTIWLDKQYKEHQAMHDPLTGLPNRRMFHDRFSQVLARPTPEQPVALMIIDLDRFKEINDTLGHHTGDVMLQQIGPRISNLLRTSDTIGRMGGDEFAVLLPSISDAAGAVHVADKIMKALEEPFVIDGLALDIEASIGISLYPDHGADANTLMQRADIAMYMAKEAHTGYELYAAERDQHSPQRLALLGELRKAIEVGQFVLHFQPMVEMRSGRVTAVEALVRWEHPKYGLMMPDEFIPLAEHTGLIRPLTLRVLDQALEQGRAWRSQGLEMRIAVNLSVRNLQDGEFPDQVADLLRMYEADPSWLEFEITESAIVVDPIRAMGVLSRLSTMGIHLSLDDFGTGYSSLAYLKRLPVGEIKIDKSFVLNMVVDEDDAVIVRSTIELARNLGLRVVAEGVETQEAWERLDGFGCDFAQGFFLSRPGPADQITEWIRDAEPSETRQVS